MYTCQQVLRPQVQVQVQVLVLRPQVQVQVQVLGPQVQVQVQVQVLRPQVRVQVQVLRPQVQVQVLQTWTRVQLEYKYKYQVHISDPYNTLCVPKHGILSPKYTEKRAASGGLRPQTLSASYPPNVRHKSPPLVLGLFVRAFPFPAPTLPVLSPFSSPTSPFSHFTPSLSFPTEVNKKLSYRGQNALSVIKTWTQYRQCQRSRHSLTLNISETVRDIYNELLMETHALRRMSFRMTLSDLEWISEILNDMKHCACRLSATAELLVILLLTATGLSPWLPKMIAVTEKNVSLGQYLIRRSYSNLFLEMIA